jgi:hypothetical protein
MTDCLECEALAIVDRMMTAEENEQMLAWAKKHEDNGASIVYHEHGGPPLYARYMNPVLSHRIEQARFLLSVVGDKGR